MDEKEYSVSEAVRLIGVESHVLRYWEEELQIAIRRTSQGHRVYSQENIDTFCQVKKLKEKGIQLKAIRVLLFEAEQDSKEAEDGILQRMLDADEVECSDTYEILTLDKEPDNLRQFELILKRMMEEVVSEQNEKLERAIAEMIRDEIEDLYLQYYHMTQEAAASVQKSGKREGKIAEFLRRFRR